MKHRRSAKKLSRTTSQRQALFRGLINSLIKHHSLVTTQAKAKAIQPKIDKLVTRAKQDSVSNRRLIHAFLQDKTSLQRLFKIIVPALKKRSSGFTKITKLSPRRGDAALRVKIEWTDSIDSSDFQSKSVSKTKPTLKKKAKKASSSTQTKLPSPIKSKIVQPSVKAKPIMPRKTLDS